MKNKIVKYYFTTKRNNEYIIYYILDNDNCEIYFDLKNNEFKDSNYKKTNLFEQFEVLRNVTHIIEKNLYSGLIFYIKIHNNKFKTVYDYIIYKYNFEIFYDIEIKNDYIVFRRNDFTIF